MNQYTFFYDNLVCLFVWMTVFRVQAKPTSQSTIKLTKQIVNMFRKAALLQVIVQIVCHQQGITILPTIGMVLEDS